MVLSRDIKYYVSGVDIATTRFSDYSFNENKEWRENKNIKGCVYGTPIRVTSKIEEETPMFVIEMNNDRNRIEGIGFMMNELRSDSYKKRIHANPNLNRYVYEGMYRIDKSQIKEEYHKKVIWVLEMLLFKGAKHSKRSIGITKLPSWLKYNRFEYNFGETIWEMFEMYAGIEIPNRRDMHEMHEMREINEK
jgi:hypothetical protein